MLQLLHRLLHTETVCSNSQFHNLHYLLLATYASHFLPLIYVILNKKALFKVLIEFIAMDDVAC